VIRPALVLALIVALTVAARSFLPPGAVSIGSAGAALGFGFLLLAALQTGQLFHAIHLPHLTGFILCGAVVGPEVLGFLDEASVGELAVMKRVAVGFIGLLAGCELNFKALRPKLRTIGTFGLAGMLGALIVLFLAFQGVLAFLPATRGLGLGARTMIALLASNALVAFSPPVVIGVINEARARGPFSEVCVPLVVLADLAIVVTFSLTNAIARGVFPAAGDGSAVSALAIHIFGSIAIGLLFGVALALYMTRVRERVPLVVFGCLIVIAEVGLALHLDPLLVGLAAGLFLENISPVSGHEVVHATEPAAMPTFVIFFATVGAELHVHAFLSVVGFSALAALARASGLFTGVRLVAKKVDAPPVIAKHIPFTMLPQAGIALALANTIKTSYAGWGEAVGTILLGTVVVNEVLGPILFRAALARAGEIPADDPPASSQEPEPTAPGAELSPVPASEA
jgi:Kef-type K+ transport system membrane component KefB